MKINFEYSSLNRQSTCDVFLKSQDSEILPMHCHPNYELNLVIRGSGTRYVGNNSEKFEAGDLVLLAPGVPHRWENDPHAKQSYSSLVFHLQEEFFGSACKLAPEFEGIRVLFELSCKGLKFEKYIGNELINRQAELIHLPPFEKCVLLLQLLNDLAKAQEFKVLCTQDSLTQKYNFNNTRIDIVHEYIEKKYSEKITLAEIASLVNMSEGAFSRYFSKTTKKTFVGYLNEYRTKIACKLLKETDMRSNEIGYACGYESLQLFYRQFLKYWDCSPQTYRRRAQSLAFP